MKNIDVLIDSFFQTHPFEKIPDNANYEKILSNYFAMSQAFPYIQAGSAKEIVFHYMSKNEDIPEHAELTMVVGSFLCWDEIGGLSPTVSRGLKALPSLLETGRRFHSNYLRKDCKFIFGDTFSPEYSEITRTYLNSLYNGLSSLCPMTRVAYMVSFENHAYAMIDALWNRISKKFKLEKNQLTYFLIHVGGDDPAEAYHVDMTNKLIEKIIPDDRKDEFYSIFKSAYALHYNWCLDLSNLGTLEKTN